MRKRIEKAASKADHNSGKQQGRGAARATVPEKPVVKIPAVKAAARSPEPVKARPVSSDSIHAGKGRKRKPVRRTRPSGSLRIPPILLEGDQPPMPATPQPSGPGTKFALTPRGRLKSEAELGGELPASYETGRLFLAARDPHWLYATWDFSREQQQELNARSRDGHLVIRVFSGDESAPAVAEIHLHPESRDWFINVPQAATRYFAELGLFRASGEWQSISRSSSTFTPPDAPSPETKIEFATIPPEISFQQVVKAVEHVAAANEPLLEAVARASESVRPPEPQPVSIPKKQVKAPPPPISTQAKAATPENRAEARVDLPVRIEAARPWSNARRKALARLINLDSKRRVWMGSLEITELVRRQLQEEAASISAAELAGNRDRAARSFGMINAESSRMPGLPAGARKFWFKVNAELIIYGSTEPDAHVTIADRAVKLRPDGTFTFRFSLPDGRYALPATAVSSDGTETREARLEFSRVTAYRGEVQAHPQDPQLRAPKPEHIS